MALLIFAVAIQSAAWELVLDPRDDGEGLNPVFSRDPRSFAPQANPEWGVVEQWGTTGPNEDDPRQRAPWPAGDDREALNAQDRRPMLVSQIYHRKASPEEQWVGVRKALKNQSIVVRRSEKDASGELDVEYKLRVAIVKMPRVEQLGNLHELNPSVWRRVVVHGRTTLRALHDRVLGPAFGWRRGYHCYTFTDLSDGAVMGPTTCRANDIMHEAFRAGCAPGCVLEDEGLLLADLVSKPGERLLYTYDLGDTWFHMITVEQTKRVKRRSLNTAKVIDGANACPPEDTVGIEGMGADDYEEAVLQKKKLSTFVKEGIERAANYVGRSFDPFAFSRRAAQARVRAAEKSRPIEPSDYAAGNPVSSRGRSGTTFFGPDAFGFEGTGDFGGDKHYPPGGSQTHSGSKRFKDEM